MSGPFNRRLTSLNFGGRGWGGEKINELQLNGDAETVKQVDTTLKKLECDIVATSDTIIIAQVPTIVDIPRRIFEIMSPSISLLKLS